LVLVLVVAAVAVLVSFLGGMITESAKETTLADRLRSTGEEHNLCVGSNLLLMKGDAPARLLR
jgi:hypothetical protein